MSAAVIWFTRDLRLADNESVNAAVRSAAHVYPVFTTEFESTGLWSRGTASREWLRRSLLALDRDLRARGSGLTVLEGPTPQALAEFCKAVEASSVHVMVATTPHGLSNQKRVEEYLSSRGIAVTSHQTALLGEPAFPSKKDGTGYRVFAPYYKAAKQAATSGLHPPPERIESGREILPLDLSSLTDADYAPAPATTDLAHHHPPDIETYWTPGEQGARHALGRFIDDSIDEYATDRDRPDLGGTSRLSAHLAFGEISVNRILLEALARGESAEPFVRQLYWREFAYHTLHHHPESDTRPLNPSFERFPWNREHELFDSWRLGRTGFPLVDAGMRQLLQTGWMHNRVRMVVASFLTKDLLIPWQDGASWFWDRLIDADLANNSFGWQWTAGSGADAAPFFRIFNPTIQSEKFDPDGAYIRTWIPELSRLDTRWIHRPHEAPDEVLADAGIRRGVTYPAPIVDHPEARARALAAYRSLG